ncbi:hypothetical protein [Slackia isoflavoniconvertens]|uniref:hypothetical protein n=1 Tax=Slackia isoflavoniconvertens TaxID=572010 RepID=UPI003A8DED27
MRNQKDRVIRNANVPFSSAGFLPLAFLGLGIYRAWIEIVFVGSFVDFPSAHFATRDLFDIVMSIVLLGCALGARKVSPFYSKHAAWVLCGMLLTSQPCARFRHCSIQESPNTLPSSHRLRAAWALHS